MGPLIGAGVLIFICFYLSLEIKVDNSPDKIIIWYNNTEGGRSYKVIYK